MFRKCLSLALIGLLINLASFSAAAAATKAEKEAQFIERVKVGAAKLGTGPEAHIEVNLRDNTKLKGYVSAASDPGFIVTDPKTGAACLSLTHRSNRSRATTLIPGLPSRSVY